mmetsp:Transcript_41492/g.90339  ORF Transcript_41492/g.90339 Transcript_41492/m.90339 type:complete len:443 (+) Transcript_41492:39-1367(+)
MAGRIRQWALTALVAAQAPPAPDDGGEPFGGASHLLQGAAPWPQVPFSEDDLDNQERISAWVHRYYYSQERYNPTIWKEVEEDLERLAVAADTMPSLALGVALSLYSFFWWADGTEGNSADIDVPHQLVAMKLFRKSIAAQQCDSQVLDDNMFVYRQCNVRWRYLMMIATEVSRELARKRPGASLTAQVIQESDEYFQTLRQLPFFKPHDLYTPYDTSFNEDFFPQGMARWGPIWVPNRMPAEKVGVAKFMEEHYPVFKEELLGLLQVENGAVFSRLFWENQNAETQFGPRDDDWMPVYMVRGGKFHDEMCRLVPRSCELLRTRPEITQCSSGGTGSGFIHLRPGARLKPHYGNAPRMSAHLALVIPPATKMTVGGETVHWEEGKAIVFDDTYVHIVTNDGSQPRFIMNMWFCHPCDGSNNRVTQENAAELCQPQARRSRVL